LRQTNPAEAGIPLAFTLRTDKSGIPFVASVREANLGFYQNVILKIARDEFILK
jgi:hypothetical protein